MAQHCDTCESLAQAVGESDCLAITETFANWKTGRSQPRWKRYLKILGKIEKRYGLRPGHLSALLAKPASPRQAFLKSVPETFRAIVRWHLPKDFDGRSVEEREEITAWIRSNVIANGTKYGRYQSAVTRNAFSVVFPGLRGIRRSFRRDGEACQSKARFGRIGSTIAAPPLLAAQMQDFALFKTASLPPVGLRRFQKWSQATANGGIYMYGLVFGALAAPPESHTRGYGVKPADLSFGMLAFPKVWDWYLRWREQRRGFFTPNETKVLLEVRSNLRRPTGWMRQNPLLPLHIRPIEGLISEEDIVSARNNWDDTCENCIAVLKDLLSELRHVERRHRDPCEPVLAVLGTDRPLSEYKKIPLEILKYMPSRSAAPLPTAICVRSYLIIRLAMHLGFRQRNLRELLLCPVGEKARSETDLETLRRAELRWSDKGGGWEVFAPAIAFKNSKSSFFKNHPFRLLLTNSEGLYEIVDDYITSHRAVLLAGRPDPGTLFVRSAQNAKHLPEYDMFSFYEAWRGIIRRYGIYNPFTKRGAIEGLLPHGSHALRGVIATHILKQTGSYELASFAIQDAVETVVHTYTRFLPHEKVARAAEILNQVWVPNRGRSNTSKSFRG